MMDGISELKRLATAISPTIENDWEKFASLWKPFSAKRKEVLTITGEKEKFLYFVLDGIQRVYYFDQQNREATLVFTYPPSFGGVLDSMLLGSPSKYFYETLTTSTFVRALYSEIEELAQTTLSIELMIKKGISQSLSGVLERLVELQCFSSEDKFRHLLHRSPHILQLVPHKYLANYLGIDPTNFSKLINRVKI